MFFKGRNIRAATLAAFVLGELLRGTAGAELPFFRRVPQSCLEQAANQIDALEQQLHEQGTVVIKAPDVWGESRLTKHRQEFEEQLAEKLDDFGIKLNASLRRSDQSFLSNALAIQAALSQGVGIPGVDPNAAPANGTTAANPYLILNTLTSGISDTPAADAKPGVPISREAISSQTDVKFESGLRTTAVSGTELSIGLEPTIELDQLKRYIDHLHEIRRINEGDDTSDSPGYSLNLVRIPVSILPGDQTRKGHGAEVTITAIPQVTTELLPRVYRELVINDLVDAMGLSMIKMAEEWDRLAFEPGKGGDVCKPTRKYRAAWTALTESQCLSGVLERFPDSNAALLGAGAANELPSRIQLAQDLLVVPFLTPQAETTGKDRQDRQDRQRINELLRPYGGSSEELPLNMQQQTQAAAEKGISSLGVSTSGIARNSRQPFAPSQALAVIGARELWMTSYSFWRSNDGDAQSRHLPDSRAFLAEQLSAAYDYLALPENQHLWEMVPQIHNAVRTDDVHQLMSLRGQVIKDHHVIDGGTWAPVPGAPSPITSCAWWVLVESALLNERLNEDMQRVSQDPECQCMGGYFAFYGANPPEESRLAFIDYVNCRWPIHVFALDPVHQTQNVADQFGMRRELQLAMALAFASGNANIQNVLKYGRRLEMELETISLNQTAVAFGHGDDTFGWRFTPRVQTPPIESSISAAYRQLFTGGPGRDSMRRHWELESGQRECVAVVLMPSFIDRVTFQSRGNFYKLIDPRLDLFPKDDLRAKVAQNVRWSEQLQMLDQTLYQVQCESQRFLPGEVDRVQARVQQLGKRLPLQTVHSRVPNENTLGGFEMFSSGITDLGPELYDYYGEPAIDADQETTLFLVGKHFSVHDTQVLAGHRLCKFSLISREIMRVEIPAGVQVTTSLEQGTDCEERYVDVHIATPYGVTSHLHIPVITPPCSDPKLAWATNQIPLLFKYKVANKVYTVESTDILAGQVRELAISAPPYGTAATQNFDVEVVLKADLASIGVASFKSAAPFANVKLRLDRKQYVVDGPDFGTFVVAVKNGVVALLKEVDESAIPQTLDLEVIARDANGTAVEGSLHIVVELQKK